MVEHLYPGAAVVGPVGADGADKADLGAGGARGLLGELHHRPIPAPAVEIELP